MSNVSIQQAVQIALQHHAAGRLREAETIYRQVLEKDPNNFSSLHLLGVIAHQAGRNEMAVELIQNAVAVNPLYAEAYNDLGVIFAAMQKPFEAAAAFQKALQIRPLYAEAKKALEDLCRKVPALLQSKQVEQFVRGPGADECLKQSAELLKANRNEEALELAQRAVRSAPAQVKAQEHLAAVLRRMDRLEEAVAAQEELLLIQADNAEGWNQLCVDCRRARKLERSIVAGREAVKLKPDFHEAHCNLGKALLQAGLWPEGWAELEHRRLTAPYLAQNPEIAGRRWDGAELRGRTILLHTDGCDLDSMHFIRYTHLVAERQGRVVVMCPSSLTSLFKTAPWVQRVYPNGAKLPPYDFHLPLGSLPHVLQTTLEKVPSAIPYLICDRGRVDKWKDKLRPVAGKLKVGVRWAGSAACTEDRRRSLPLKLFAPLMKVSDVAMLSLQKGGDPKWSSEVPPELQGLGRMPDFKTWADTAALISQLDLVISVDTAVAHLAGAMGRTVWLMLPWESDWRWMNDGDESPWYPTMQIFRQEKPGDWDTLVKQVVHGVKEKARELI
jgi:tetratricopeptide (TPR) repeat protein